MGNDGDLVKLSFWPNPHYSPPSRKLAVYHALTGEIWIDPVATRLARIDGRLFEDLNFFLGLGHLDKGGTFQVVQKDVGDGHWDIVLLDLNMHGRIAFFKSLNARQRQILDNYHRVRDDLTYAQALEMLQKVDRPGPGGGTQQAESRK